MNPKHKLPPWLRPKTPQVLQVGVGWYTEGEWTKVKKSAVDPERFEATYAEWLSMANEALKKLKSSGVNAERAFVDSNTLLAWCLARNKPNDAASRAEFVSEQQSRAK